jgi:hypothetical protein
MAERDVRVEVERVSRLPASVVEEVASASPTPFQTPLYGSAFEAVGARVLLVRASGPDAPLGHALVMEETLMGFRRWVGLAAPAVRNGASPERFWDALLSAGQRRGVLSAAWRDPSITRLAPSDLAAVQACAHRRGVAYVTGGFGAHVLALDRPLDALWDGLDRKHRNAIRAAERAGVVARPCAPAEFADLYSPISDATWRRSGMPGPGRAYFAHLMEARPKDPWALPFLARDTNGAPVAGAVATVWNGASVYLHGGDVRAADGASTLLQWEIIRDLHARGVRTYDFGGGAMPGAPDDNEKAAGIRRFKERFGGAFSPWPALHLTLRPRMYEVAKRLVRMRRALRWPSG